MQRKKIVLITVVILLIVVLISVILRLFVFDRISPLKSLPSFENGQAIPPPAGGQNSKALDPVQPLPIQYNHPNVRSVVIRYEFEGILLRFEGQAPNLELVTDIRVTDGPKFMMDQKTKVYTLKDKKTKVAKIEDLKPDQKIRIIMIYDLNRKAWTMTSVGIVL